jgi:hypothetical protein
MAAVKEEQVKAALQKSGVPVEALVTHNEVWGHAVNKKYKALGLANQAANTELKYTEMIAAETVDSGRLKKLAHERAQAVKQYFVLHLAVASETILLDSDARCESLGSCSASEAVFTLEI